MNHTPDTLVNEHEETNILNRIHKGMNVIDSTGDDIGEVAFVYLGAATPYERERGVGAVTANPAYEPGDNSFVQMLADAFDATDIPDELVERLRQSGFLRIDRHGLFAVDRFATADQVASVADNEVHLSVTDSELIKPE